jgi:hypothetical protein
MARSGSLPSVIKGKRKVLFTSSLARRINKDNLRRLLLLFAEKMVLSISFSLFIRYADGWESPYNSSPADAV